MGFHKKIIKATLHPSRNRVVTHDAMLQNKVTECLKKTSPSF